MSEIKNAVIESASISSDDHGVLTAWLFLDYGGAGQGFGGIVLYVPNTFRKHQINSPAGHFIWRVMEVAGVTKWSELKGKTVRVDAEMNSVKGIGHIVKNDWFYPEKDFDQGEGE